jgi:hypothetical protein
MELQKHGIGKPAPSGNVAPAPAAVRPVQGDVAASGAASSAVAGDAASVRRPVPPPAQWRRRRPPCRRS